MKRFRIAQRALRDLEEIDEFISADSPEAAHRLLDHFYRTFHLIAQMPGMGHRRDDLTYRNIRFWSLDSYVIVYFPAEPLQIVRVVHSRRDIRGLLR